MTPLRLIVGIGNPGSEYRATRHNAGAWFVERLAQAVGASLGMQAKFQALVASVRANDGIDRRLALPQTFMNRSGQAVSALARFYRIAPEEILIAHDELDLKPGAVKLKARRRQRRSQWAQGYRRIARHAGLLAAQNRHRPPA